MKIKKIATFGVAAGLLAGGLAVASPASADPVTGGYALVGSDTLQDSVNALTNGTTVTGGSVRVTAGGTAVGNFDAFGSSLIRTKSSGAYFVRPAGSGNGRNALISSITGAAWNGVTITGQIDIARSSSGPSTNANDEGDLLYVPYGRDAVSYAYSAADSAAAAVLDSLTKAQLIQLYTATSTGAATTIDGVTIYPRLPQSGSGTRDFFLQVLGGGTAISPGAAVPAADRTGVGPAENDATELTDTNDPNYHQNQIIPFSAGSWIAQSNGAAPSTIGSTGVKLGFPGGAQPYGGSGNALTPDTTYYASEFGRDTYLIVEYARVNSADPKYDAKLAALVAPGTANNSLVSWPAGSTFPISSVGAVKAKFGFLKPSDADPIRAYPAVY